ncbi:hypothetical protein ACMA1I_03075 [Pontibacter sp. 13R65]|uniref:hypothetical protein n=1 Tax=Pontibacter sp. 13R65 TaxID=3127458 RepID=UPI0039C9EFD8
MNIILRQIAKKKALLPGAPFDAKLLGEGALFKERSTSFSHLDFFGSFCIKTKRTTRQAMK